MSEDDVIQQHSVSMIVMGPKHSLSIELEEARFPAELKSMYPVMIQDPTRIHFGGSDSVERFRITTAKHTKRQAAAILANLKKIVSSFCDPPQAMLTGTTLAEIPIWTTATPMKSICARVEAMLLYVIVYRGVYLEDHHSLCVLYHKNGPS